MSKNIGVLDIGSGSFKLLIFNIQDEEPEFLYYSKAPSKGIEKGTIVRGSSARRALNELIKKSSQFVSDISELYVLISHPKIKFENEKIEFEPEEKDLAVTSEDEEEANLIEIEPYHLDLLKKQITEKVKEKGYTVIHVIPRYFILDGDIYYEPVGLTASKLEAEYHIIKLPKQVYLNISHLLKSLGLKVKRIFFPPYVASYDLFDEEDVEKNILILDLGHTTTSFAYFKQGAPLISGVIPKGGKLITELIAETYFLSFNEAENLKKQIGYKPNFEEELQSEEAKTITLTNKEGKLITIKEAEISYLIREGLLDIIEPLLVQLYENYKLDLERDIDEIILIGGGAQLKGIKEFFEEIKLELEVPWNIRVGVSSNVENYGLALSDEEKPEAVEGEKEDNLLASPEFASLRGTAWFLTRLKQQNDSFSGESNPLLLEDIKEEPSFEEATTVELEPETKTSEKKLGFFQKITQFIKKVFSED